MIEYSFVGIEENEEFFNRISNMSVKDTNLNSIVAWASTTQMVVYAIKDILSNLKESFLQETDGQKNLHSS